MNEILIARALSEGRYEWVHISGKIISVYPENGDIGALTAAAGPRPVTLIMDGRDVHVLEVSIPAKSYRQAKQAAPFAIEDDVADDLEKLHVVCSRSETSGKRAVAVIGRQLIEENIEVLRTANINIEKIIPDFLALPRRDDCWSVMQLDDRVLVRTGEEYGFSCDGELLATLLERLELESPLGIDIYGMAVPIPLPNLPPIQQHRVEGAEMVFLAATVMSSNLLDVLPDRYRAVAHFGKQGLKITTIFLVLALILHLGLSWRTSQRLSSEVARLRSDESTLLKQSFPEISRVVNAELQAQQVLTELRAHRGNDSGVLEILHLVGQSMRNGTNQGLELSGINYADGVVNLRITASDIASLERFSGALKSSLQVDVVNVEAGQGNVVGSLRLQALAGGKT